MGVLLVQSSVQENYVHHCSDAAGGEGGPLGGTVDLGTLGEHNSSSSVAEESQTLTAGKDGEEEMAKEDAG